MQSLNSLQPMTAPTGLPVADPQGWMPTPGTLPERERSVQRNNPRTQKNNSTDPATLIEANTPETSLFFVGVVSAVIFEGAAVMLVLYVSSLFG